MNATRAAQAPARTQAPTALAMSERTDDRLVEDHLAGDAFAFAELVRRYQHRAATLAWRLLGHADDVEDICQEAFLKAHQKVGELKHAGSFFPWFFSIVLNLCRERLRTRQRVAARVAAHAGNLGRTLPIGDLPDEAMPEAGNSLQEEERRLGLERALEQLPVAYRQVIVLRCYEGLSYTEIAQVMRCRKRTVRWRLYRARQILRRRLRQFE